MTILPIRQIGDPVLRTPSAPVPLTEDGTLEPRILTLIANMEQTCQDAGGIGIAAPQVGVNLRIFTWDIDGNSGAVINPELQLSGQPVFTPRESADEDAEAVVKEGCLSVAGEVQGRGIHGPVARYPHAVLTGISPDGSPLRVAAEGLLSACFQHEVDHLDGRLFIDRLTGEHRRVAFRQLRASTPA